MTIRQQGICPVCGSEELDYGTADIMDESVSYPWTCAQCHATGREVHGLSFDDHYDVVRDEKSADGVTIVVEELCSISPCGGDGDRVEGVRTVVYQSSKPTLLEAFEEYAGEGFDSDNIVRSDDDFEGKCLDTMRYLSVREEQ